MVEQLPPWLLPFLKAAAWVFEKLGSGFMAKTVAIVMLLLPVLCTAALGTTAIINIITYRDTVRWRAEETERFQQQMEALATTWMEELTARMREEEERTEDEREAESELNNKRYLFERIVGNSSLISNCDRIPLHILSDIYEIRRRFADDQEVVEAYTMLVMESNPSLERRRVLLGDLFEAMARATNSEGRFPTVPTYAPAFTARCY